MLWRVNCITVGIMSAKTAYSREGNILPRLNAVRLFVVVMIAFGYASTMPVGPDKFETGKLFGYEPSWIGIQVLFFLSGVLAYRSITAGRIGFEYLKSRILRTFPMLLALTLTTVFVIYPVLGKPLSTPQEYIALAKYFFLTVTCIDPGRVLPGLLDDSLYACLIQGGIWTLRWGLIIHIGVAIASRFKVLMQPRLILAAAITSMLIYAAYIYAAAKLEFGDPPAPIIGLHFGYMFLMGMALWAYRDRLPRSSGARYAIGGALFAVAAVNYLALPWTSFIEISLTLSFGYTAWLLSTSTTRRLAILNNWPQLALGLYLINWPTTQVLLHAFPELGSTTLPLVSLPISLALTVTSHVALSGRINQAIERKLLRKVTVQTTRL